MSRLSSGLCLSVFLLAACQSNTAPRAAEAPTTLEARDADDAAPASPNFARTAAGEAPADALGAVQAARQQRFADIPLPADAREDVERTYVYESPVLAVGRMVYTSREDANALAKFYLGEMPEQGWKLERVVQAEGVQLVFRKPGKRLDVGIGALGAGRGQQLVLHLIPEEAPAL